MFLSFNQKKANEIVNKCKDCMRTIIIGSPRSGKSFFIEKHLKDKLPNVTIEEFTVGVGGQPEAGIGIFNRIRSWVKKLTYRVKVEDKELMKLLGEKAPKHIVEDARKKVGDSPHIAYYISWYEAEDWIKNPSEYDISEDVRSALEFIIDAFRNKKIKIKWINAEYIPPGLVKDVLELIRSKGLEEAKKELEIWVGAYFEVLKILGIHEKVEWESALSAFVINFIEEVMKGFLTATQFIISGIFGGGVVAGLFAIFTHKASKESGGNYINEILKLRENLRKLCKQSSDDCKEFNELGKLIVYKVASTMGIRYEDVQDALKYIIGLSEEELKKQVQEIKERIEEVEKNVELLKKQVITDVIMADLAKFGEGEIYSNVRVINEELKVLGDFGYCRIVRAGSFGNLVSEVEGRLGSSGFVVLVGPKGIGKSTLAATAIWDLLNSGKVGLVLRIKDLPKIGDFRSFIENYLIELGKYFGDLLILYDPTGTYEAVSDVEVPNRLTTTVMNMLEAVKRTVENAKSIIGGEPTIKVKLLIVLSTDLYGTLSKEVRDKLENYKLDVSLNDIEFLAEIIREYSSGCGIGNKVLYGLAREVANFDSGHALIARLIGEELVRNKCNVGEVRELINSAENRAELFIAQYINKFFDVIDDNRAKALVEIFALRRPFVDILSPGIPILTPGIVEIIRGSNDPRQMTLEMVSWLVYRQHDLIEETIRKILDGKDLGEASNPWRKPKVIEKLREVSEKMRNVVNVRIYFVKNYGKDFMETLKDFSDKCWKRAALITGYSLAGRILLPQAEDLPWNVVELLNDALKPCGVDDYLLVGNIIPSLIEVLILGSRFELSTIVEAFVDKYNDAISEIKNVLNNARREGITPAERLYGLGLALIVASAVKLGKDVSSDDIDAAIRIASSAVQYVALISYKPILYILKPLRDKAPHSYLTLLAVASTVELLDSETARLVFDELNYILNIHRDEVKKHAWSLVDAMSAYSELFIKHFNKHLSYLDNKMVEEMVGRVAELLRELGDTVLGTIVWAFALAPALIHEHVRMLMERELHIDVIKKVDYVINKLNELRENVKELLGDEEFMGYAESIFFKADENAVKKIILSKSLYLKNTLAHYKLNKDELNEAAGLFEKVANGIKEIGEFENYLISRCWVLRVKAIEGSLTSNDLVKKYDQLFNEAWNNFVPTVPYLDQTSDILYNYLVSLALTNNINKACELLKKYWAILNVDEKLSVITRLILNILLGSKNGLDDRLKDMLVVDPEELIEVFEDEMRNEFLPALKIAYGLVKPEDGIRECEELAKDQAKIRCKDAVLAVGGRGDAIERVRGLLIDNFQESILIKEKRDLFKELGVDYNELLSMFDKFMELVYGLDGRSLVQLIAPNDLGSRARLALMLYALINGNHELVKAHALYDTAWTSSKLIIRLLLEAYKTCCDLSSENFRKALARLSFYHY
jgi:gas vesicle protein